MGLSMTRDLFENLAAPATIDPNQEAKSLILTIETFIG